MITTGKKRYSCLSGGFCCCVSFWFWREIGSFFVVAGNYYYDQKKKDTVICLAGARSLLRPEKKKIQSSVCWVRGSGDYDRKKKRYSRLSGGFCCCVYCVSFWFWREIGRFFCCGGKFLLRPEKKDLLRRESFITTGKKVLSFLLWRESFITTGKKVLFILEKQLANISDRGFLLLRNTLLLYSLLLWRES